MAVTIAEVAKVAGVSTSTVSRAFTTPDLVHDDTRQHVLAVARRLGYTPNRIARSLAMGRTRSIGLIVPDIANPFFATLAKAAQARARRREYAVFLADTDEHPAEEYELARAITKQVDGLLLVSPRMSEDHLYEIVELIPTVLVNRRVEGLPAVAVPSADGMRQAVEHLHALGHRRCAYVSGPRNSWSNQQRRAAVGDACADLGMELVEFGPYEPKFDAGVRSADLIRGAGATAVIAHNDVVALGVIFKLSERGVVVPRDISVVGVDDTIIASTANPALTTVRLPLRELGVHAVDAMLETLDAGIDRPPSVIELETALIVRGTTGPARVEPHRR